MTFLNPFVLVGLAAAAIPVLIHLLNLRRLRTVEFSSLRFLKELQKTSLRRLKIQQLLLLLLRTLLVILLVLAFSRPALRGSLAGVMGSRASSTIVILLDDSPSMGMRNTGGALFSQARDAIHDILESADGDDTVFLIPLSSLREKGFSGEAASSVPAALNSLSTMETSQISVPLKEGLPHIREILGRSTHPNNELYIVSDAQRTQIPLADTPVDSAQGLDPNVRCFLMTVPPSTGSNLGAGPVEVRTQILAKDRPVSLEATVRNPGEITVQNSIVSVYLDGSRVAQQSVTIPPRSTASVPFTLFPKRRGILEAHLELEDDVLEIDNSFYFTITVPRLIRILLVGTTGPATRFAELALTLGGDTTAAGLFGVDREAVDRLPFLDLSGYDVLVLCGVPEFTPTVGDRFGQFVRNGGGLMIFPGPESNLSNYNRSLFRALAIPPARQVQGQAGAPRDPTTESFLSFSRIDMDHPVFDEMFKETSPQEKTSPSVESPRIRTAFSPAPGAAGHAIIGLSDGSSFLTEFKTGNGKVLVFAVDAGLEWSDFPLKGLFAPLLHRSMLYLASTHAKADRFETGESIETTIRLHSNENGGTFFLRSPGKREERLAPEFLTAQGILHIASLPAVETGIHALVRKIPGEGPAGGNEDLVGAFPVNIREGESDLRTISGDESAALWQTLGVREDRGRLLEPGDKVVEIIKESRYGVELWQYLLGAALLLAVVEMAISREGKHDTAPIA
ncbi:MAG: BatA domain-containing protein [Bacteroidota bacterium]